MLHERLPYPRGFIARAATATGLAQPRRLRRQPLAGTARESLCWPMAVAAHDGVLAVADLGNDRVSLWRIEG